MNDEKEVNKHMKKDHDKWVALVAKLEKEHEQYVAEKTAEIVDLKESLRDVMFFMEAGKLVGGSELRDEITEGQVVVGPSAADNAAAASTSKKEQRRKKR